MGAVEQQRTMIYHFKGFITEFSVELGFFGRDLPRISFVVDGAVCSCGLDFWFNRIFNDVTLDCWNTCDAHTYVSGDTCLPCPAWCTKGCINNGCTTS